MKLEFDDGALCKRFKARFIDLTLTCIQSSRLLSKDCNSYCVIILQDCEKMTALCGRYLLFLVYFSTFPAWSDESSNADYSRAARTSSGGMSWIILAYRVVKSALAVLLSELKEFKPHMNITPLKGSALLQEFFPWVPRCFGETLS